MPVKVSYDACFSVNNYRGMGVFMNALKNVLTGYESIEVTGVCNRPVNDACIQQFGSRAYPIWEQVSLPFYLRRNRRDVFIFPYNTMPLFLPGYLKKVLILHDLIFMEKTVQSTHSVKQFFGRYYRRLLVSNAYRKADVVITVSEYSRNRVQELLGNKEKIYVIPNIIKEELAFVPGIVNKEKYLLNVGGQAPSKNIFSLIRAYILLPEEIVKVCKLKLVGNYSDSFIKKGYDLVEKSGIDRGRVEFLNYVNDHELARLYSGCSLFVFPSLHEGFGIPVVEAMKFERPLLVSNASCMPEIAGDAALYFDPLSVTDIKEKIEFALSPGYLFENYKQHYKTQLGKYSNTVFTNKVKKFVEAEILTIKH